MATFLELPEKRARSMILNQIPTIWLKKIVKIGVGDSEIIAERAK